MAVDLLSHISVVTYFCCHIFLMFVELIGYDMAVKAASEAYQQAGVGPGEVDVVELHDCFSTNELITYEALVSVNLVLGLRLTMAL